MSKYKMYLSLGYCLEFLHCQIGIYNTKQAINPAMPTNEQATPPIRICILYNPEGSLEALLFQLSVMLYITAGKNNINNPATNKNILPNISIPSHSFVKFKFIKYLTLPKIKSFSQYYWNFTVSTSWNFI